MTLIPHRTVAGQIAAQLRADMERGAWQDWLPSERDLSRTLQASRNTIRAALAQLRAEGFLRPHRGFPRDALAFDPASGQWRRAGDMPFSLVTTTLTTWRGRIVIPGGEARPGVRSTQVWAAESKEP